MDKYFCGHCNYTTYKYNHYNRHITTKGHINNISGNVRIELSNPIYKYCKYCNKGYTKPNSLWYHEKKCKIKHDEIINQAEIMVEHIFDKKLNHIIQNTEEKMNTVIQSNENHVKLLKEELKEEIQTMNEKIDKVKPYTFNLNFFLNEQCKNAICMDTFLYQLKPKFIMGNTLEKDAILIMTDALTKMDWCIRPIHCVDLKRNKVCIKDNDKWTEDVNVFDKVPKFIEKAYRHEIDTWEKQHPEFMNDSEDMSVFIQHMAKFGKVMNSLKILRPVLKVTTIPKNELKNI